MPTQSLTMEKAYLYHYRFILFGLVLYIINIHIIIN